MYLSTVIKNIFAWNSRSPKEQKRIALFLLLAAVLLPAFLWSWIDSASSDALQEKQNLMLRYERALPLAAQAGDYMDSDSESLSSLSPLAATQSALRNGGLEDKLSSLRPYGTSSGQSGVQLYLERLNMIEILQLFETLNNIPELHVASSRLNRRMDNPEHMDVRLVLDR